MELTPEEGRVLGALVEKELTTPQGYPLTDNGLLAACNQTTSRDPVVSYDVATLRLAVRSLREQGLLRTVHRTGERSDKHRHELPTALDLSHEQVVVLAVLLLRGAQTAAELRARSERMHAFASVQEVERVLAELAARGEPLARRLERQPGRKEPRWVQLLAAGGVPAAGALTGGDATPPARELAAEPAHDPEAVVAAVLRDLEAALRARDVEAAVATFAHDAMEVGATSAEVAHGASAIRSALQLLVTKPYTVRWEWERVLARGQHAVIWFLCVGECVLEGHDARRLPYRMSGVVVRRDGRHVLAQLHGSSPTD